ncbi:phosphotransferase [Spiractinospora alimapuensis]|uniref:phosphotransferase n=1 Tax=Spiractinospora alimapuensis TaxID=2820884 RepID=UPI001F3C7AFC|nr:phosphotransferase [Spiractinospora alimapuensis]QVQ52893.1 phosphotransferase [Spiractinospora alimapuensis]
MATGTLPTWLTEWCVRNVGVKPARVLFEPRRMSTVWGLRLADGREVVVKAREDGGRVVSCVAAQDRLARNGFPCPRPLTPALRVGSLTVHAEESHPGGELLSGDSPDVVGRYAGVFAWLMAELARTGDERGEADVLPLPNPRWVRWDHSGPGLWPAVEELDARDQTRVPGHVTHAAERARARLLASDLPRVLGHADFEAQNLRWHGDDALVVHDWDSLAWQPEAALVGAASGTFTSASPPTLASVDASEEFLRVYQERRGRAFDTEESRVAWAASLWPAAHNARWEALHGASPICATAVREQAEERLRRAGV